MILLPKSLTYNTDPGYSKPQALRACNNSSCFKSTSKEVLILQRTFAGVFAFFYEKCNLTFKALSLAQKQKTNKNVKMKNRLNLNNTLSHFLEFKHELNFFEFFWSAGWWNYVIVLSKQMLRQSNFCSFILRAAVVAQLVGRAVASKSIGPQFESSHRQTLYYLYTVNCIEMTKIKKKEAGNGPFKKTWEHKWIKKI